MFEKKSSKASVVAAVTIIVIGFGVGFYLARDVFCQDDRPKMVDRLKKSTVMILVGENRSLAGTGIVVLDNDNNPVVITNEHVRLSGLPLFMRVNMPDGIVDYSAELIKSDPSLDVALLKINKILPEQAGFPKNMALSRDMFDDPQNIIEGKEAFFIGYPLRAGVEEKDFAITRQGMVAQIVAGRDTFLVDGFASHGNSGSPVFDDSNGKLMGIVKSFESDYIDAYEKYPGGGRRLMSRIPFTTGLSKVISIEAIKKFIIEAKK